jgi:bifunctional non-homologous end joining protein LigD
VTVDYLPQLATLVTTAPAGDDWLHEIKLDGYRLGCAIGPAGVTLTSRNGLDYTTTLPEIVAAARTLHTRDTLLDGELVVFLEDGRASFQALQHALSNTRGRAGLVYCVFDALQIDGEPLLAQPLEARKAKLAALLARRPTPRIRYADHVVGHGPEFFAQATMLGVEGIVSKRRDARYHPGRRTGWLKIKCVRTQPFVIGGYTDQDGMQGGLGALLIGYYDGDRLAFAGRVGTGFTQKSGADMLRKLQPLARTSSPFTPAPAGPLARAAHYVEPALACRVAFTEWTDEDRVRHPVFHGLVAGLDLRRIGRDPG